MVSHRFRQTPAAAQCGGVRAADRNATNSSEAGYPPKQLGNTAPTNVGELCVGGKGVASNY